MTIYLTLLPSYICTRDLNLMTDRHVRRESGHRSQGKHLVTTTNPSLRSPSTWKPDDNNRACLLSTALQRGSGKVESPACLTALTRTKRDTQRNDGCPLSSAHGSTQEDALRPHSLDRSLRTAEAGQTESFHLASPWSLLLTTQLHPGNRDNTKASRNVTSECGWASRRLHVQSHCTTGSL